MGSQQGGGRQLDARRGFLEGRHFQRMTSARHDPYQARAKPDGPALCPDCGLVFLRDRWKRAAAPAGAHPTRCPACLRVNDGFAAATLSIRGTSLERDRDGLERQIRAFAARRNALHPLQRIMAIAVDDGEMTVTTTDLHLAQGIAKSLHRARKGNLTIHFDKRQYSLRIAWVD